MEPEDIRHNLPRLRAWNVTKRGIEGRIYNSLNHVDGTWISEEISELDGDIVRIRGRRHVLEEPSSGVHAQAEMEFCDDPLDLVRKRVRA